MSRASLESQIPPEARLLLDSSTVIAYLNGSEAASQAAALVMDQFIRTGRNPAAISTVTVTEVLVRPFQSGVESAIGTAEAFLSQFPNLTVVPVDFAVAREGARVRAASGLRAPDALVIATALVAGIPLVVANDVRWERALAALGSPISLCHLDAHTPI